jgi:hypothetical protein
MQWMSDKLALRIARGSGIALLAITAATAARAQAEDPLKSPACGEAIADLQSARSAHAAPAQVERLRAHAQGVCLGSTTVPRRPPRVAQQPIAVPPPQIDVPSRATILGAPSLPPPPAPVPHFPAPAQCDPGGCWVDDGSHLQYVPPTLVTPRGRCTQQGALVYCP